MATHTDRVASILKDVESLVPYVDPAARLKLAVIQANLALLGLQLAVQATPAAITRPADPLSDDADYRAGLTD